MERNQSFENSLRCLQHPLSLVSIALLLLNDHVLKVISPSWVTGKLSDFAGLFFFPFLVATVLSIFLTRLNLSTRKIGLLAFGFSAIWFILIKTFQPVNLITVEIVSQVLNKPSQILLDPTDSIAVVAVIPAWMLWIQPRFPSRTRPTAYIALIIGLLSVIATSPREWAVHSVTNLEYRNDGIVLAADKDGWGENSYPVAKSSDGGLTWERASDINNIEERGLPIKLCSHADPNICFRVTKNGVLEESYDNGTTWTIVADGAHDLIFFEWDNKEYVIVAIGERGVFRRELPDAEWEKIAVINARR